MVALWAMARKEASPAAFFVRYGVIAVAAFIGEDTCIRGYRFYSYAPGWWLQMDQVPLLVPLIWPLVILSADQVGRAVGVSRRWAWLWAFGCVAVDASLVEVVAVRAGYWTWVERGHLEVPVIGILGWGFFAAGAILPKAWPLVSGPVAVHIGIQATWWGLFRHTMRVDLSPASTYVVAALSLGLVIAIVLTGRTGRVPFAVAGPRMLAAGLFVVLLATLVPSVPLYVHLAAVAVPYLVMTEWRARTRWPASQRAATPPSPPGKGPAPPSPDG